jgi:hypothetical protein
MSKIDDCFSGQQEADYAAAEKTRADLAAAKQRIEELETALQRALNVGEIRFKTCALAADVHNEIVRLLK